MIKRELLDIIYLSTREPSDSVSQAGLIPRNPETVDAPKCKAQTDGAPGRALMSQTGISSQLGLLCEGVKWHRSKDHF